MTIDFDQFITTEELVKLYYCEGQSLEELADYLGVDRKTLISYMDDLDLPRRQNAGGRKNERGVICPYCGSRGSKIYRAYWSPKHMIYIRYRRCKVCTGRFKTVEMTIEKLMAEGRLKK